MGTTVEIYLEAPPSRFAAGVLEAAVSEFERLESLLSRFRPDSELSRLNRNGTVIAGPDLLRVLGDALDARETTGGRFDPTVHDALVEAGYDRSFELIAPDGTDGPSAPAGARCNGRVDVDRASGRVVVEDGFRIDLGGIAKGDAVERVGDLVAEAGPCLVNAGGDLSARGTPRAGFWPVGVETSEGVISLALRSGALATSGRDHRRWQVGARECHHLIDPRTGKPSQTDILRATVFAADASAAEVQAKNLLLAGEVGARQLATCRKIPCLLVTQDERDLWLGGLGG
jgi:thiamine biosynthesis lipoprotein